MKNTIANELIISTILIVLSLLFLDPLMIIMPKTAVYVLAAGILILFAFFAGLIWGEKTHDEREEYIKRVASRIGYITGIGVLILGIIVQAFNSHVDSWLVLTLVAMILAKITGGIYGRKSI